MSDQQLRAHLVRLLTERQAHVGFDDAVDGVPPELRGVRPKPGTHTAWQLVEHLRIAQQDIFEFSRDADYQAPDWPSGYWPESEAPPTESAWDDSIDAFHRDLEAMVQLVKDPENDLFTPFPWGDGQTLLREAMLIADHNAYHIGQLVFLRRLLGNWHPS